MAAQRMSVLGLSRQQLHGLFVLVGLHAGCPRTQTEMDSLFQTLDEVLPSDREQPIDQVVGEFYHGYESILGEYCFRTGYEFDFRDIVPFDGAKTLHILEIRDWGLLDPSITAINSLAESSRLTLSLVERLGRSTSDNNRSLLDAFLCGGFQTQLLAFSDMYGAVQLKLALGDRLPLFFGSLFDALVRNEIKYFNSLEAIQVPLFNLCRGAEHSFVAQLWGFQSWALFDNGVRVFQVDDLGPADWHQYVVAIGRAFSKKNPDALIPFSQSGAQLTDLPFWNANIEEFTLVDKFITRVWGYSADELRNSIELLEYKALVIYVVYASMTTAREPGC